MRLPSFACRGCMQGWRARAGMGGAYRARGEGVHARSEVTCRVHAGMGGRVQSWGVPMCGVHARIGGAYRAYGGTCRDGGCPCAEGWWGMRGICGGTCKAGGAYVWGACRNGGAYTRVHSGDVGGTCRAGGAYEAGGCLQVGGACWRGTQESRGCLGTYSHCMAQALLPPGWVSSPAQAGRAASPLRSAQHLAVPPALHRGS